MEETKNRSIISVGETSDVELEYSEAEQQEMLDRYVKSFKDISDNEIHKGRIIQITSTEVVVDIGFKSEGLIPVDEFPNVEELKLGDEIEVFLEN
ncbi:MAG: S1 RNA-binding domain-containing protein, partial [Candidatus Delongbacteria bacterium]|nr:S1 RNA-binding domain-containing protein [Candidatus Delongbacteria bacterium]